MGSSNDTGAQATARAAVRDFLVSRRSRIRPEQVGLGTFGGHRRVKGLRREEVALLSGISAEYYVRLERGQAAGPSAAVLNAVADTLRLDTAEREHLARLLAAVSGGRGSTHPRVASDRLRPGVQVMLDALTTLPAFVFNGRLDVIAANSLGRVLYAPLFQDTGAAPQTTANTVPNTARFCYLHEERARTLWPDWEAMAHDAVALLRAEAGRHPDDPALVDLIGTLSTRSPAFRTRWAAQDVRQYAAGVKRVRHPLVGELQMPFENVHVAAEPGQFLMTYTPQPGSAAHDALQVLASWNAADNASCDPRDAAGRTGESQGSEVVRDRAIDSGL